MKNRLIKLTLLSLLTAAFVAAPVLSRAEDSTTATAATAPAKKKGLPFHGKVAAIDPTQKTVTVGSLTISITPTTKITKDGKKATLSDFVVGDTVAGAYQKDDSGKLNATTIHDGKKQKKKKAADAAN
jgi:hypothetical protein